MPCHDSDKTKKIHTNIKISTRAHQRSEPARMALLLVFLAALHGCKTTEVSQLDAQGTPLAQEAQNRPIPLSENAITELLDNHNQARNQVGVTQNLVWSPELALYAQEWAFYLASHGCEMQHRQTLGQDKRLVGENIFWGSALTKTYKKGAVIERIERNPQQIPPATVVDSWVSEKQDYDLTTNRCAAGKPCGHYTQVVWNSTRTVGCAAVLCPDDGQIWVCNYEPPGNYRGKRPY
ncbi:MAG: CAP domain-containing protein [Magnetococcus sp. YQC-5]